MKPSLLFNGVLAANTRKTFTVEGAAATVFAAGLAGTEKLSLQILNKDEEPSEATATSWTDVKVSGTARVLDVNTTVLIIESPGVYALLSTVTAAAVTSGLYGG